jgi:hypothetical protein
VVNKEGVFWIVDRKKEVGVLQVGDNNSIKELISSSSSKSMPYKLRLLSSRLSFLRTMILPTLLWLAFRSSERSFPEHTSHSKITRRAK